MVDNRELAASSERLSPCICEFPMLSLDIARSSESYEEPPAPWTPALEAAKLDKCVQRAQCLASGYVENALATARAVQAPDEVASSLECTLQCLRLDTPEAAGNAYRAMSRALGSCPKGVYDGLHTTLRGTSRYVIDHLVWRAQARAPVGNESLFTESLKNALRGDLDETDRDTMSKFGHSYSRTVASVFKHAHLSKAKAAGVKRGRRNARVRTRAGAVAAAPGLERQESSDRWDLVIPGSTSGINAGCTVIEGWQVVD